MAMPGRVCMAMAMLCCQTTIFSKFWRANRLDTFENAQPLSGRLATLMHTGVICLSGIILLENKHMHLFVLFINDLPQVVESPVALFADDTKVFREIQLDEDRQKLQQDIDELLIWSKKWQLPFNESKCKVMHYGKTNQKADYNLGGVNIKEVSDEKDLGVTFDQQLSFGTNASKIVAAANSRLGLINRHLGTLIPNHS